MNKVFILAFGLLITNYLPAQQRRNFLVRKLDSIFSSFNQSTPGVAVTVIRNGTVLVKKSYGMASLEFGVPFKHNTLVRLPYSEGRAFISVTAALMEKEGILHLNDKVKKYFPKLPAWSEMVTIQDLLNHSSGFADEWATLALTQASMANRLDRSQFLQFLYNQPAPSVEPGKGYMYSNSDFGLLRLVMEKASGENLSTYIKHKVFDRLGMKNTRLHDDKEAVFSNHAFTYNIDTGNTYKLWLQDKTSPGGNYYVLTSAGDLERWAAANSDKHSFIYAAVERLKVNARPIPVLPGTNYVFGHKIRKIGGYEAIAHMGVSELPYMAEIPEKQLSVIITSNLFLPHWNLMEKVLKAALKLPVSLKTESELSPGFYKEQAKELDSFAGIYKWNLPLTFQSYIPRKRFTEFVGDDTSLKILYSDTDTLELTPLSKNMFRDPEYPDIFTFLQPHPDSAISVILKTFDGNTIKMVRVDSKQPKINKEQLLKLTGKYYSRHLDYYWTLELNDNDELLLKRPTIADKIIKQAADGEFMLMMDYGPYQSEGWIRFYFDENGHVTHLTVTHPRLVAHKFEKIPK